MATAERFYATKNDERVPVVYDWENTREAVEEFPGGTLWEARRLADHLNGKHAHRRNPRCPECRTGA